MVTVHAFGKLLSFAPSPLRLRSGQAPSGLMRGTFCEQLQKIDIVPKVGAWKSFGYSEKIFLFSGSEFDFFYFSKRGCSTGESKKMYQ